MDTMDYTLSNPQPILNHDSNGPRSCPDLAQHDGMASVNGAMLQNRESHIYDPVHNTGAWYNNPSNPLQGRAPLPIPNSQTYQQWPSSPPPPHASWNWPGVSRIHSRPIEFGSLDVRPQHYMGLSGAPPLWTPNHEPPSFNSYRPFTSNPVNNQLPTAPESGRGPQQAFPPPASQSTPQIPPPFPIPNPHGLRNTRPNNNPTYSNTRTTPQRRANDVTVDRGTRPSPMEGVEGQSPARTRTTRSFTSHSRRRGGDFTDMDDEEPDYMGGYEWSQQLGQFSAEVDNERAMAVLRGAQAAAKRVPPKAVLDSFEKVDITELSNDDRTCTICYNEFGVQNPEGLNESPVRLPKCRHVFGDHCIKKWFEEQDTCPYCRDKLPSEPARSKFGQMDRLRFYRMAGGMNPLPDEYRFFIQGSPLDPVNTHVHSPLTRSSIADSPERRRTRGRSGNSRVLPSITRPTSIGSARFIPPTGNHQANTQRPQFHGTRSITPGLSRQGSTTRSTGQGPTRLRLSGGNTAPEEFSPAVAVGSGAMPTPPTTFHSTASSDNRTSHDSWPPEPLNPHFQSNNNAHQPWQSGATSRPDTAQTRPSISSITNQTPELSNGSSHRPAPDLNTDLMTGLRTVLRDTTSGDQRPRWS